MKKIVEDYKCTGCAACRNICRRDAISMEMDKEGFLMPVINQSKCNDCNLCQKVCPILNVRKNIDKRSYYAGYANDSIVVSKSSSGGIFFLIAKKVIEEGGVVYGAAIGENFKVIHQRVETIADLEPLQKSKYVQSEIRNVYRLAKQDIFEGKKVLFSGTPCQIAGLKNFLNQEYDQLICLDVICHGVPNYYVFKRYLANLEKKYVDHIKSVEFRNKKKGWKKGVRYKIEFASGDVYEESVEKDPYLFAFNHNLILRLSCSACQFKGKSDYADISLGDCWGIHEVCKELDNDKGVSLILVNTVKGEKIIEQIRNQMFFKEVESSIAIKNNIAIEFSHNAHHNRKKFFEMLNIDDYNIGALLLKYSQDYWYKRLFILIKKTIGRCLRAIRIYSL